MADDGIIRPSAERSAGRLAPATRVSLDRTDSPFTDDERLWEVIRDRTEAITFTNYKEFVDKLTVDDLVFRGVEAYQTLKAATLAWLQLEAGVWLEPANSVYTDVTATKAATSLKGHATAPQDVTDLRDNYLDTLSGNLSVLPYHKLIVDALGTVPVKPNLAVFGEYGILPSQVFRPILLELIWSYWHEEGLLVQSMNAVSRRIQCRAGGGPGQDPLMRLELNPLHPVNNLIWGYIQDEWNLLTVQRRAYEYQHEYGISLLGKAIQGFNPADSRTRFLTAFHDLLMLCSSFYDADDDTTVIADAFPVLNALADVHVMLAEGAHNQFGDLVWTARAEMLVQQWLLSRPELREFLGGRAMVPYREPWMDRVDTMKQIQGWGDTSVTHFRDLGVFGERILLSIRYGNWSVINDATAAENWARYWRTEVKSYMHSYRAVTGVDLTGNVQPSIEASSDGRYLQPAVLLQRRVEQGRRPAALGGGERGIPRRGQAGVAGGLPAPSRPALGA